MAKITFDVGNSDTRDIANIAVTNKTERQELSIEKWRNSGGKGILHIVPRFGKTRIALMIVEKMLKKDYTTSISVITPSLAVSEQWRDEIIAYEEMFKVRMFNNITIITRHVWLKQTTITDLIVYDEYHKYLTTSNSIERLNSDVSRFKLGLTGTNVESADPLPLTNVIPIVDEITESEAIKNNWINDYDEYNVSLTPSFNFETLYVKYSDFIKETFTLFSGMAKAINNADLQDDAHFGFKSDYEVLTACLAGRKNFTNGQYVHGPSIRNLVSIISGWKTTLNLHNQYERSIEDNWNPQAVMNRVRTFNSFIRDRKKLIDTHSIKLEAIVKMVLKNPHTETMIYVGNIDFAEEVREAINNVLGIDTAITFHSKIPSKPIINKATGTYFTYASGAKKGLPKIFGKKKLKEHYINGIKGGLYKIIITVESLNEGINIPNLKRVIMAAGSRNVITYQQRAARSKTIDTNDLNKQSEVINLYFDNFVYRGDKYYNVDKAKLLTRQKKLNDSAITYVKFDDFIK